MARNSFDSDRTFTKLNNWKTNGGVLRSAYLVAGCQRPHSVRIRTSYNEDTKVVLYVGREILTFTVGLSQHRTPKNSFDSDKTITKFKNWKSNGGLLGSGMSRRLEAVGRT